MADPWFSFCSVVFSWFFTSRSSSHRFLRFRLSSCSRLFVLFQRCLSTFISVFLCHVVYIPSRLSVHVSCCACLSGHIFLSFLSFLTLSRNTQKPSLLISPWNRLDGTCVDTFIPCRGPESVPDPPAVPVGALYRVSCLCRMGVHTLQGVTTL